jgi:uncharacterized protein (DUF885 family)
MNKILFSLLAAGLFCTAHAASSASAAATVAARVAAQNALFDEYYQSDLKAHPERATSYGDYRYNDRLDDVSLAAVAQQHASDASFLERLDAISTDGLAEQDALSHAALRAGIAQRLENYRFKEFRRRRAARASRLGPRASQ